MSPGIRHFTQWLGHIFSGVGSLVRSLRIRRHQMQFNDLHQVELDRDSALLSTGYGPIVDLSSDWMELPRRWCWLRIGWVNDDIPTLPRLLVHTPASSEPDRLLLASSADPILLRLPEHVSRIQLVPANGPGHTNLRSVQIAEVGKLRLFLRLVWDRPRTAWPTYRAAPSLAGFRLKLIEDAQQRPRQALDWLQVYHSGVHSSAIPYSVGSEFIIVLDGTGAEAEKLKEAIASIVAQTYARWRLIVGGIGEAVKHTALDALVKSSPKMSCVEAVGGEALASIRGDLPDATTYVLFMGSDDILEPHALARLAMASAHANSDMLYGDKALVESVGIRYVSLEALPAFSYIEYLGAPARIQPVALRAKLALRPQERCDPTGHVGLNMILHALEQDLRVTHVPDVLSRTRLQRKVPRLPAKAAKEVSTLETAHLRRMGYLEAEVSPLNSSGAFSIRHHRRPNGRVLAVVPTKNRHALLKTCIDTVRATTRALQLDIAVVDHQSTDTKTVAYLRCLPELGISVIPYQGGFNYSALNNTAVNRLGDDYDYYLFLNNDIEAIGDGWLESMLDVAAPSHVGVIGATLLYPDHRIQHAGVIVSSVGIAQHAYRFARLEDYSDLPYGPHLTREYVAVTGACMLVKSAAFKKAGGFDDELEVGYNDIDLCLRIRETGLRVVNCAGAVLIHHESASRGTFQHGRDPHPRDTRRFAERHANLLQEGDPFFSPLLDAQDPRFTPKPDALRELQIRPRTVDHKAASYKGAHRR